MSVDIKETIDDIGDKIEDFGDDIEDFVMKGMKKFGCKVVKKNKERGSKVPDFIMKIFDDMCEGKM